MMLIVIMVTKTKPPVIFLSAFFNLTLILIQNLSNVMKKTESIKKLMLMAK